ncbi:RNA polymerase sigma-70 factor [Parabacteroides hominis]|jgi:RNA polymerase sigma-70 factor (family 1)|uniref:RNA polymerase sigma-70 factor n=1 Tax=Parabacteroides hominis TaxID=2763057 RepID=A0ABR7DQL1_9BACT|nr:RNA polymerase sigma-70 factor [Parabacteroides hominis]MBC5633637.1 RNA polymerase sigma-70 factor [Parabacteroides hominis]MBD9167131.1 RNA polymerase sigma-70 factor [Parabacteroides johnsonii]
MFDISLLYELKKGNREAFNGVFRYYYPRMMAYVASMVEQKAAEDIVQDVFLYVWENHEKLYVSEGFHSYLFQSAYTRCLDYFKKNLSIEKYHSHTYEKYLEDYQNLLKGDNPVIEELSVKDFYRHLYELLEHLPAQRREVFILTYIKGLTTKEVAEQTRIPQRTVESHLYLALRFLKGHMSRNDYYMLCAILLSHGIHA